MFLLRYVIIRLVCPLCNRLKAGGGHSSRIMEPFMSQFQGQDKSFYENFSNGLRGSIVDSILKTFGRTKYAMGREYL